ncbi:cell division protein ZapA [Sphingomonas naasensis]|uniref:Cell division protein ZapA n=1 Tax=Sphingomonas naasensis TaxID=1344951 RepID=A0A4S1WQE5_9SPHN|nr:cell division protein ZapA [Sphingomonas naasensis]NIJ20093.1 cell division protein ZapA [Sphingomonas naasensis]TGX44250.1 cell division protein ZapA [Sphingomonas naasensis]
MADIDLSIAGRSYSIAARDGDEPHLRHLEAILQQHAQTAQRASGGLNAERTLVYLALILADMVDEVQRNPPQGVSPVLLDRIADRLEAVAAALEEDAAEA